MDTNWDALIGSGYEPRAAYACDPAASRGRLIPEAKSRTRTDFQRDRDRIIHSTAFRRLKHKTQVFVSHEGDHYRTRLTHTIEVSQIARSLARAFRLDEDLAEAIALVHDFGHTPFGHTGEEALDEKMKRWGGFDHNAQSLRVVTALEHRYAEFDGLNLTWETLEGLVKHNGPMIGSFDANAEKVPQTILDYCAHHDLELHRHAGLEAQVAAISDDIAYNTHDIDDGLRAGLFSLEELEEIEFAASILDEVRGQYPRLEEMRIAHEFMRRQITQMVEDVVQVVVEGLKAIKPQSADDIRDCGRTLAAFSPGVAEADRQLKAFLFSHVYRHRTVVRRRKAAAQIVSDLFDAYCAQPDEIPGSHPKTADMSEEAVRAVIVSDYLAGMTDNFAISEHQRLFDHTPEFG